MTAMNAMIPQAGLIRRIASFVRDRRGVSAVEFAMLLPLMITLYLGTVEISQGVAIDRKVTLTTRAVADLTSQLSTLNDADIANILNAAVTVISPFDQSKLKVAVSGVDIDASGAVTVTWTKTLNGSAGDPSAVTLPDAFKINNTTVILSQVSYAYTPAIGYVLTDTINLSDHMFMRPRLGDKITYTP